MMRRLLIVLLLLAMVIAAGCSKDKTQDEAREVKEVTKQAASLGETPSKVVEGFINSITEKNFKQAHVMLSPNSGKSVTPDQMQKSFTYDISLKKVLNEQKKDNVALVAVCLLINDTIAGKRYVFDYVPLVKVQNDWKIMTEVTEKVEHQTVLDQMQQEQERLMYKDQELNKFRLWMEEQNAIFAKPLAADKSTNK